MKAVDPPRLREDPAAPERLRAALAMEADEPSPADLALVRSRVIERIESGDPGRFRYDDDPAMDGFRLALSAEDADLPTTEEMRLLRERLSADRTSPRGAPARRDVRRRRQTARVALACALVAACAAAAYAVRRASPRPPANPSVTTATPANRSPIASLAPPSAAPSPANPSAPASPLAPAEDLRSAHSEPPRPADVPELASSSTEAAPPRAPSPKATRTTAPSSDQPEDEALWLEHARAALDTNPEEALRLTRRHQQRFPDGVLSQEREAIAVDALLRMGRGDEARARADRFRASFPDSPLRSKIDRLVQDAGSTGTESAP